MDERYSHRDGQIERAKRRTEITRDRRLMGQAIGVFDRGLLLDLQGVGYTPQTIALVEFAALLRIAWADGYVSDRQRDAIFQIAARECLGHGTPAQVRLHAWLECCPSDDVFDVSLSGIHAKFERLQAEVRGALQRQFIRDCTAVALAADNVLADNKIAVEEGRVIARIIVSLKSGRPIR